ncbi:unnamed protein product [Acanthosepion pharaonis]|uniref:Uncharacterized protein n=1 Tax=Acanthosepion pharaonis TaxID=158019 RepID=A0A812CTF8_ACAPH|nr:unnamed protein product [Sepia pharaonis]
MNSRRKKNRKEIPKEIIELKKFLHAYEKLCICSNSQVNPWIKENAKRCIEKHEALTKIILDFSHLSDTPPVLFATIITSLRQTRYKYIKHIYVWNYPMSYENVAMLANYIENPAYKTYTLHLMDCLLTSHFLERVTRVIPSCKFLSDICLDYNE